MLRTRALCGMVVGFLAGCGSKGSPSLAVDASSPESAAPVPAICAIPAGADPDYSSTLGCDADYQALASESLDTSIPGATSVKTVIDRADKNALYFQNSKRYCIHWDFASTHLSGGKHQVVPALSQFNATEYYSPDRRFLLGALSYYAGPKKWVYEISPYDAADAAMIATSFEVLRAGLWIGRELAFHPTSSRIDGIVKELPSSVPIVTTDQLFKGIDYQPLNPRTSTGILRFHKAAEVDGQYTPFREIVVLDAIPNDISIVAGIITSEFQTPLAHINVLSVNRRTPNMAVRGAYQSPQLLALKDKWVELRVGGNDWSIREISQAEAEAWWAANKPKPLTVQPMNLAVTDMREVSEIVDASVSLATGIGQAIPIFGAKATNYGVMSKAQKLGAFAALPAIDGPGPIAPGFGMPMFYYDQFMKDNGLYDRMSALMAQTQWSDPVYREKALEAFKDELRAAPIRSEVVSAVVARAAELFPGEDIRFRSSTNSEDLGQFTGAGLYNSETGKPSVAGDRKDSVGWAIKKVWSQVWNPRAYEEREYFSMKHLDVGMALLVHANFPQEEAQGVALTNNPFDASGVEPAFYVNAQLGTNDVVSPNPGVLPDSYLQYFNSPGQPVVYVQHSTLVPAGKTVLSESQVSRLGIALDVIHKYFFKAYGVGNDWYTLDVEWKFDDKLTPGTPRLFIKQARPYPRPQSETAGGCQVKN